MRGFVLTIDYDTRSDHRISFQLSARLECRVEQAGCVYFHLVTLISVLYILTLDAFGITLPSAVTEGSVASRPMSTNFDCDQGRFVFEYFNDPTDR